MGKKFLFFLIILLALFLRLWQLDVFPVGITHDELDFVINSKAIFLTGKDITGTWSPFSLTAMPAGQPTSELPSLIILPIVGTLRLSQFTGRLPYALSSIALIFFIYLIVNKIIDSKTALLSAFFLAINPWSIHFGRAAFEPPLVTLFYFVSFYIILKFKSWKVLFAFPFLFLAFYSYTGTKLIFLPFVVIAIYINYCLFNKRIFKIQYLSLFILAFLLFTFYIFGFSSQRAAERKEELIFFAKSEIEQKVNTERTESLFSEIGNYFSNKPGYLIRKFLYSYAGSFSPQFLFTAGEDRGAYSIWTHGLFYYLDFLFLIIGLIVLFINNRKAWFTFILLILIAPLPSAISNLGQSYVIRSNLLFPLLVIFIAYGVKVFNAKYKKAAFFVLVAYIILIANYLYLYFSRYPVYGSEGFFFSEKVMSIYSKRANKESQNIFVTVKDPRSVYLEYIFHNNLYNDLTSQVITSSLQNNHYSLNNVNFLSACPNLDMIKEEKNTVIINKDFVCEEVSEYLKNNPMPNKTAIANTADAGLIFTILNDNLCNKYELSRYPRPQTISDFKFENLNDEQFCKKWISQPEQAVFRSETSVTLE